MSGVQVIMSVFATNSDGTKVPMIEHLLRDLRHAVLHDSEEVEIASVYIDKQSYLVVPVGADLAPEVENASADSFPADKKKKGTALDDASSATTTKRSPACPRLVLRMLQRLVPPVRGMPAVRRRRRRSLAHPRVD